MTAQLTPLTPPIHASHLPAVETGPWAASTVSRLPIDELGGPDELARSSHSALEELAARIRGFLVEKVCAVGGHLGANLGVVELTIALHRVFDSPQDVLLFDTGHQAYVHKILTGRVGAFDRLRQHGGLSGYPSRTESAHDWIENSHASTALSYADGIAKALQHTGGMAGTAVGRPASDGHGRHVVAVVGDGALTGGLAWEGLNNLAAAADRPVIVVLNDNGRSYAPTTGGIAHHLQRLRIRRRRGGWLLSAGKVLFEELGLTYIGPVDGHDVAAVEDALTRAKALNRTVVVHCVTIKGRGYLPAEADDADRMHGIGVLDPATGKPRTVEKPSWTGVFSDEIAAIAADRPDIVAVTAAMLQPVGLGTFAERFPGRVFDVGIAEQHAVCSAAGLAMGGLHPVVAVYATFLNRAFDQILMDVALHKLGVTFVLDRAGITGPDGASHHGMWDIAMLSAVPRLRIAAPRDPARLRQLLREAVDISDAPTVIRFPKAPLGPDIKGVESVDGIDILHRSSMLPRDVLFVTAGIMAEPALWAATLLEQAGIGVTVADPRWILPVNPALTQLADQHRLTITLEDGLRVGGMGTAILQSCADVGVTRPIHTMGLPHAFISAGDRSALLAEHNLTGPAIALAVQDIMKTIQQFGLPSRPVSLAGAPTDGWLS